MLLFILGLLICQHMSATWSTRLPLEVYELTPVSAAAASNDSSSSGSSGGGHATHQLNYLKHKSLEYATVHAKTLAAAANSADTHANNNNNNELATTTVTSTNTTTGSDVASAAADLTVIAGNANANTQQQLDRRRSRQMLSILEQQQQQRQQHQQQPVQHHFGHDGLHLQKLHTQPKQQQQHQLSRHGHASDVRILYQVGESEDDLPICAANAVCSKIDLYETPWIERQCRCPEVNRLPNVIVHHHHQHGNTGGGGGANKAHSADKYRSYLEKEKMLQHQRLLSNDYADNKIDHADIKQLMQKLGAVHEDDLQLYASDYLAAHGANNEAVPSLEDLDEISDNEFPHATRRSSSYGGAHMRHSGHMGHNRAKDISYIGGCPSSLGIEDGHTIADKTRHYKLCQPVHKLPVCKHFRDYTWTLTTSAELNVTEQIVHCRCPKNSVTYLTKREPAEDGSSSYTYLFACSPLTRIRCQRKQPCKLFTVRKRQEFLDEVNINALCQCPRAHHCPSHHTQSGVIPGETFLEDNIQTYSGYCMAND